MCIPVFYAKHGAIMLLTRKSFCIGWTNNVNSWQQIRWFHNEKIVWIIELPLLSATKGKNKNKRYVDLFLVIV